MLLIKLLAVHELISHPLWDNWDVSDAPADSCCFTFDPFFFLIPFLSSYSLFCHCTPSSIIFNFDLSVHGLSSAQPTREKWPNNCDISRSDQHLHLLAHLLLQSGIRASAFICLYFGFLFCCVLLPSMRLYYVTLFSALCCCLSCESSLTILNSIWSSTILENAEMDPEVDNVFSKISWSMVSNAFDKSMNGAAWRCICHRPCLNPGCCGYNTVCYFSPDRRAAECSQRTPGL